ncbi:phosphate acyltransferase PlsX [Corallococcus sp. H22C18031201]|uniref:phosphate acyltransferase PlsX n=1 Tax=Citreicoccus inhibens TaxID=2849499 RepID=UPI000E71DE67|nr:phosphate acyltransferase PlsX [Citreicoccus inhibens]MBU8894907.1 phosphate acyltransferase PlsX [Citreicoccus inhibens]RJS27554.1 phosphate acyltransferase PlsX [Corallococcus sp. H22C18031201]
MVGKPEQITIAFDVMGGDYGPTEVVRGAAQLSLESPHIHTLLVGDRRLIDEVLAQTKHNGERLSIHHAAEYVGMDEKPGEALARKPQASVSVAARLVAEGEAQALVSAGNTGAGVLACARHFQLIPGVRRAALATVYPTRGVRGEKQDPFSLILDVGATVEATADDLVAFAVMGSAYARIISRNERPKVALLSNGVEPQKGPPRVTEAHARLLAMPNLNFTGNVEGIDIPKGTADVIVTDGFVGNVCLKMLEGVHDTVMELAQYAYKESLRWRAGLAMLSSGIQRLKDITDWEQYGGAPILGFDRIFIKAHGRSRARAIANAGKVAAKAVAHELGTAIREGLER